MASQGGMRVPLRVSSVAAQVAMVVMPTTALLMKSDTGPSFEALTSSRVRSRAKAAA